MICNIDSIGKYMLEIIIHQQRIPQLLKQKKLTQTQEDHSNLIPALNVDSLKVDLVVIQNTCSEKEDSNSETASSKPVKESSLDSATKDVHAIKYKMSKAKERCMTYFRSLHSHFQVLSKEDLKEDGFMAAFWVVNNQFQKFIDSQFTLDYDNQITDKYFVEYAGIEVKHFKDTLFQHMGNVKKSVAERTRHQRQYDRRVNKRQMQTQESKIDMGKAIDADLVVIESSRTKSEVQDDSSRSGNDTDADDADIRPIYDEEPMAEVQLTAECNIFAIGQQHTDQLEIFNKGRVDQKVFASYTSKVDSEPLHGSNVDIPNIHGYKQTLDSPIMVAKKADISRKPLSSGFTADENLLMTFELNGSKQMLYQFQHKFYKQILICFKSFTLFTTADASDKCQQQQDSTSSTSTLATTVTADGNFDM
ncbi:hypothetical protein Tco_1165408 [Tanacetum coccineum]